MTGLAVALYCGGPDFASNLAAAVTPALTGWLLQTTRSYIAPMRAILAVLLAGIASYVFLVREEYVPVRKQAK